MVFSGIGAPPNPPSRQRPSDQSARFARIRTRLYIAGTMTVWVIPSASARRRNPSTSNAGRISAAPPTERIVRMLAISPVTWLAGAASRLRSSSVSAMPSEKCRQEWTMLRWVSIAPFGAPVVPDV